MTRDVFGRAALWPLTGIVLAGAFVRFRALAFGLPHTQTRPDETAIIDPVRTLLSGHFPHFFDYPWLFLWIVCLAYLGYFVWGAAGGYFHSVGDMLASWPTRWTPFFLIPRAISAIVGTVTLLVIYRLGRQLRDHTTGVLSALFLAFTFIHVRLSHFGTTDVTMTCLIVASVTLILDAHQRDDRRRFAAAGLVAGLAAATKYNAVILVVPMLVSYGLRVAAAGWTRASLRDPGLLYFSLAFLAAFAIGVPFVVVDREPFLDAMRELAHALRVGDVHMARTNGWLHHLVYSLRYGMGIPLLVTGLAGAVVLCWFEPRTAAVLLAFPVVYYTIAGSFQLLFFRYVVAVVPFLCVTAAYLVARVTESLVAALTTPSRRTLWRTAALTVASLALVASSVARIWAFDRVMSQEDNRVVVARWFTEHVPPGSTVLQSGSRYGLVQFWDRSLGYTEWVWDGGRGVFLIRKPGEPPRRAKAGERPAWIIVQDSPLPSTTQDIVKTFLSEGYTLAGTFPALSMDPGIVYDPLDSFYVPYNGFDRIIRPGPNFTVFRRDADVIDGDSRVAAP